MSASLFGTDGVRDVANSVLTPELVCRLTRAATSWMLQSHSDQGRPQVAVGRDTRISGDLLTAAAVAGVTSAGADVCFLNVVPTPAAAHAALSSDAVIGGIIISASHNPSEYNGVKLFDADGLKLQSEDEIAIEEMMELPASSFDLPVERNVGRCLPAGDMVADYVAHLAEAAGDEGLKGLRVLLDCAHGSGYRLGPEALRRAGADVEARFDRPDGLNINQGCGSTNPGALQGEMISGNYDVGFSLDGDADRLTAVSPAGRILDGDDLLYIIARDMQERGRLDGDIMVTAIINNRGLDASLQERGITVTHCPVGDREILHEMKRVGARLGGETSGHVILADYATAGDGILTAVVTAAVMRRSGRSLDDLLEGLVKYPQITRNVPVERKEMLEDDSVLKERISAAEQQLGEEGRLIVRASGTEPVVRVVVECPSEEQAKQTADELGVIISERLGGVDD